MADKFTPLKKQKVNNLSEESKAENQEIINESLSFILIVTNAFKKYKRGDRLTSASEIKEVLNSVHANKVNKIIRQGE